MSRVRVAAVLVAALTVLSLLLPVQAFASDAPQAPDRGSLSAANAGGVVLEQSGARASLRVDFERAYLYVYPADREAVAVGWQDAVEGTIGVDLSLMPAGEVLIALLDAEGRILGWTSAELSAENSHAPPAPAEEGGPAEAGDPLGLIVWPWAAGALLLAGISGAVLALRRRRPSIGSSEEVVHGGVRGER